MKQEYMEAFAEVDKIIELMPVTLSNKIPQKFKEIIKNEKSNTYVSNINEPIEKCQLKEETIIVLALMYRDFLCDENEKNKLKLRDAEALKVFAEELREKYNTDNIFENRRKINDGTTTETAIALVEEKWYNKIFHIIKKFFLKN